MRNRSHQIHNHEVKIGATIGIIGAILNDEDYLTFAVNGPYGLQYQLEHALLPGGLWFEGSLHYHYYALEAFMGFEKFAHNSPFSLLDKPWYASMLSLPLTLLMPNMTLPKVNDCVNGQENSATPIFTNLPSTIMAIRNTVSCWLIYTLPNRATILTPSSMGNRFRRQR